MASAILSLAVAEALVLAVMTGLLLWWYRSKDLTPNWVCAAIGVSWFLGFSGTLLLPLDIAQAVAQGTSSSGMTDIWNFMYWCACAPILSIKIE